MRHIILGNGAAGVTAADKLRDLKVDDEITIISNEGFPAYAKSMLPDYVGGKLTREKLFIREIDTYKHKNIKLILNETIKGLDIENKQIKLEDGYNLPYDKLLLAMGGIPFVPKIEGLENLKYFTINSVSDADSIIENAKKDQAAVIVGAGLAGIEMGFALRRLGMNVTIVERENRILPVQLDSCSSDILMGIMKREGINFATGKQVCKVYENGKKTVEFSDCSKLEFDMLVLTIGTRPNISLLKESSLNCNRGVLVDEYLKTSGDGIYAAGDIAEQTQNSTGGFVSSYIWPNAMAQGKCAAINMAGEPLIFSNSLLAYNTTLLRDTPFISMGLINPDTVDYETLNYHDNEKGIYKKIVIRDNKIKGMTLIGDITMGNQIGSFIRKDTDISNIKNKLLHLTPEELKNG